MENWSQFLIEAEVLPFYPLKLIGYWKGEYASEVWPDAHDFLINEPYENQEAVAAYLEKAGPMPYLTCGFSTCRICGESNGTQEKTDGHYYWPDGLAHYVKDHNLRLPQEFEEHVLSNPPCIAIPESTWPFQLNVSSDWWKNKKSTP